MAVFCLPNSGGVALEHPQQRAVLARHPDQRPRWRPRQLTKPLQDALGLLRILLVAVCMRADVAVSDAPSHRPAGNPPKSKEQARVPYEKP